MATFTAACDGCLATSRDDASAATGDGGVEDAAELPDGAAASDLVSGADLGRWDDSGLRDGSGLDSGPAVDAVADGATDDALSCPVSCTVGSHSCRQGVLSQCQQAFGDCPSWVFLQNCPGHACADAEQCQGPVLHSDLCTDDGWCWVAPYPFGSAVQALWSDGSVLWVAAQGGALYHFDGSDWSVTFLQENHEVRAFWGSAANNIWAVGAAGLMLHYNGSGWQYQPVLYNEDLVAIWGTSSDNIYVTSWGRVLHFDGADWRDLELWQGGYIAGHNSSDLCLVSALDAYIRCFDGAQWNNQNSVGLGYGNFAGLFATGDGGYWAITDWGELIYRDDSAVWRRLEQERSDGKYVAVSADGSQWFATQDNSLERGVAGQWQTIRQEANAPYVVTDDAAGQIWLGGGGGYVARFNGGAIEQLSGFDQRFAGLSNFTVAADGSLWAAGEQTARLANGEWTFWQHDTVIRNLEWIGDELLALGYSPTFQEQLLRWSGTSWQVLWQGSLQYQIQGAKLWGLSAESVYVLADPVYYWNGSTLESLSGIAGDAYAIRGVDPESLWAVGGGASIMRYRDSAWERVYANGWHGMTLTEVWPFADDDVWFYGDIGSFVHWDGQHFVGYPSPGLSFGDVLVKGHGQTLWATGGYSGYDTSLMFFDGVAWQRQRHAIGPVVYDVAETDSGTWILGRGQIKTRAKSTAPVCVAKTSTELCADLGFVCGYWLVDDGCDHTVQVSCGDCPDGPCGVESQQGQCVASPQGLDCGSSDSDGLAASGDLLLDGHFFTGLCGSEIAYLDLDRNRLVHFDMGGASELHSLSFADDLRQLLLDASGNALLVRGDNSLHRVDMSTWVAQEFAFTDAVEHVALGEPGQLFVEVFRTLPDNNSVGRPVLLVVSALTGEILFDLSHAGFQGGDMHYDPLRRALFVYGWYDLHKLAFDPRDGQLLNLEFVEDYGDYCKNLLAAVAGRYISYCSSSGLRLVDTEYLLHSTNTLLPSGFDRQNKSFPTIAPAGGEMVVQTSAGLEWVDLVSYVVTASESIDSCDYPSLEQPFFSHDAAVVYAPRGCSQQNHIYWIKGAY